MLTLPLATRVLVCREAIDMRRSFDGLEAAVRERLREDPLSGALFVFWNRRRDRLKILSFDGTGFWIWYKRLEGGRFELPGRPGDNPEVSTADLLMVLEGIEFATARRRRRWRRDPRLGLDPNQLPDDPKLLRDVISQLLGAVARLERKNAWLQAEVEALFRKLFRKHSEKLDPRQLELVFEAMRDLGISQQQLEQLEHEVAAPASRRQGRPVRRPLPKDLPRERVEHTVPEAERCCGACGTELTKIREEVTEQLDYTPASFKIIEHVRGVFACKGCEETITRAPKPPQAIEKGLPGPGLLAQVMVSKYGDHQPFYRQAQIYSRHGVTLSRSTLCGWVADAAELVRPLVDLDAQRSVAVAHCTNRRHSGHGAR